MISKWLLATAFAALAVSLLFGGLLAWHATRAYERDTPVSMNFSGADCMSPRLAVTRGKAVMSVGDSQVIQASLGNPTKTSCAIQVELGAPKFKILLDGAKLPVRLNAGEENIVVAWIISPEESGSFEVSVKAGHASQGVGIEVTGILGLPADVARAVTVIGPTLFSGVTIPWFVGFLRERKKNPKTAKRKSKRSQ